MGAPLRHDALDRNARRWLAFLGDPGARAQPPARPLRPADAGPLIEAATIHGVLPAVVRRLKAMPEAFGGGDAPPDLGEASDRLIAIAGQSLRLAALGRRVSAAFDAAGVPAILVKGPVFARRLYADPALRPFSDIDVLVAPQARPATHAVMAGLGLALREQPERTGLDYHEDQWVLPGAPGLLVEIQDDLVHAPGFAGGMALRLDDIRAAGGGDPEAATALLLVAAVHGAVGHQFDRLRYLVDLAQAVRGAAGPVDVEALAAVARRRGLLLPIAAGLDLAARLLDEPAAGALADRLDRSAGRRLCRLLWSPATVLGAQGPQRGLGSWRRQAVREMFKRRGNQAPRLET